jgi:hypothetical protein
VSALVIQQREGECLQIEPAEPFGVVGFQAMPLDAVLSDRAAASISTGLALKLDDRTAQRS